MLSKRSLRILIIAQLVLIVLSIVVAFTSESSLPEPLRAYEQARSDVDMTIRHWVLLGTGVLLIVGLLVSSIGLMVFWRPARPLYLATNIAMIAWTPFAGPYVTAGWVQAIDGVSLITIGVVLALIYWSPLSDLYEKPKSAV
jgi:hypothetical protein